MFRAAGLTIALTAITTIAVHLFFSYRLLKLSKGNYFLTVPVTLLALGRVVCAIITSIELIRLESFYDFYTHYRWLFTLGLALSAAVDVMITSGLCLYLRKSRHGGTGRLDRVLNSVTLYTVENGLLTSVITVLSLIFWLVKPHVLIYLAFHFAISKLYANSFLASMNARKLLRAQNMTSSGSEHRLPVILSHHLAGRDRRVSRMQDTVDFTSTKLQITVDKTVDYIADDPIATSSADEPNAI
ncbi:uncharacterized protein FIBRA_01899 [Fibroporia radiculosa]|uniref:DUF6534 domain-containing protein n=1 Tax=Fibroporia radiculosa TaxID=599839 RepID=J4H1I5_9APHY|nr:uncharacterized protein FIBRA_01899 [Fibroporia radiculosa]CCL99874.1 predicted protein [Fibroporia radiculosa]